MSLLKMTLAVDKQPPPTRNDNMPLYVGLCAKMNDLGYREMSHHAYARAQMGYEKHGDFLRSDNGRCAHTDCYQELLDAMFYEAQANEENPEEKWVMKMLMLIADHKRKKAHESLIINNKGTVRI